MHTPSYFEIQADDLNRAADFYTKIFGWKFKKAENTPVEYFKIETGGPRGGLLKRPGPAAAPQSGSNAFVCSMEVQNFDQSASSILAQGGKIALPKFAIPGLCWQGYFIDPEGNTFGLFEADSNAK